MYIPVMRNDEFIVRFDEILGREEGEFIKTGEEIDGDSR
jgi:hypothetical protein